MEDLLGKCNEGLLVRLTGASEFGTVVKNEHMHGHNGAWVLWTASGSLCWSPWFCLDVVGEETETSVDEQTNTRKASV